MIDRVTSERSPYLAVAATFLVTENHTQMLVNAVCGPFRCDTLARWRQATMEQVG